MRSVLWLIACTLGVGCSSNVRRAQLASERPILRVWPESAIVQVPAYGGPTYQWGNPEYRKTRDALHRREDWTEHSWDIEIPAGSGTRYGFGCGEWSREGTTLHSGDIRALMAVCEPYVFYDSAPGFNPAVELQDKGGTAAARVVDGGVELSLRGRALVARVFARCPDTVVFMRGYPHHIDDRTSVADSLLLPVDYPAASAARRRSDRCLLLSGEPRLTHVALER